MTIPRHTLLALGLLAVLLSSGQDARAQQAHPPGCTCEKELQVRNAVLRARQRAAQNQQAQQQVRQRLVRGYQQRLYRAYQQRLYSQYQQRYRSVRPAARPARRKIKYNYVGGTRYTYSSIGSYYR